MKKLLVTLVCVFPIVAIAQSPSDRGSVAGQPETLFSPGALSRGVFQLPLPLELPQEEGGALWNVFPTYSPEAGLSEWGMGWQTALTMERDPKDKSVLIGPWGPMIEGDSDPACNNTRCWYPRGLQQLVRLDMSNAATPIAYLPDGRTVFFAADGRMYRLVRVVDTLDRVTTIGYEGALVTSVTYGGVSTSAVSPYRVTLQYENVVATSSAPVFVKYRRRVSSVDVAHCTTTSDCAVRWHYSLTYENNPLTPAIFYLSAIQRTFARSGERLPPQRFSYNMHGAELSCTDPNHCATPRPATAIQAAMSATRLSARDMLSGRQGTIETGIRYSEQGAAYFDRHQDGMLDFASVIGGVTRAVGQPATLLSSEGEGDAPLYQFFSRDPSADQFVDAGLWLRPPRPPCTLKWKSVCWWVAGNCTQNACPPEWDSVFCSDEPVVLQCPLIEPPCAQCRTRNFQPCDSAPHNAVLKCDVVPVEVNCTLTAQNQLNQRMSPIDFLRSVGRLSPTKPETFLTAGGVIGQDSCGSVGRHLFFRDANDSTLLAGVDLDAGVAFQGACQQVAIDRASDALPIQLADVNQDGTQDLLRVVYARDAGVTSIVPSRLSVVANLNAPDCKPRCYDLDPASCGNVKACAMLADSNPDIGVCFAESPVRLFELSDIPSDIIAADIDSDGTVDVLTRTQDTADFFVWLRSPEPTKKLGARDAFTRTPIHFKPLPSALPISGLDQVRFLDANHDGALDMLFLGNAATVRSVASGQIAFFDPPATRPRLFLNAGVDLIDGSFHFVEVDVPGIQSGWQPGGWTVAEDFIGDGDAHLTFMFDEPFFNGDTRVFDLPLTSPSTGLMIAFDDGAGNHLFFDYARTVPLGDSRRRMTTLASVTFNSAGEPERKLVYSYSSPYLHSKLGHLVGFRFVATSLFSGTDEISRESATFYHDDTTSGVLLGSQTSDPFHGSPSRLTTCGFESATSFGVQYLRPTSCSSGAGVAGETDRFTYEGVCPRQIVHTNRQGLTLTRTVDYETRVGMVPGLANAIACLPSAEGVTDSYPNTPPTSSMTCRNVRGQPTFVFSGAGNCATGNPIGPALLMAQYEYDPQDHTLKWVRQPGRGTTAYEYMDGRRPALARVFAPDGGMVDLSDVDPLTALPRSIVIGGYRRCFLYDGQERLSQTWDNVLDCSAPLPMTTFSYQRAAGGVGGVGSLGVVLRRDMVDLTARQTQTIAQIVTAAGNPVTRALQVPSGWALGPIIQRGFYDHSAVTRAYAADQPAKNPFLLSLSDLAKPEKIVSEYRMSGTGSPISQTRFFHGVVAQRMSFSTDVVASGLDVTATENGEFRTVSSLSDDGERVLSYLDQADARGRYQYDATGRLRSVTLPNGDTAAVSYDAHGRTSVISRRSANIAHTLGISYAYDAASGLLRSQRFTVDGDVEHFELTAYDPIGRPTTTAFADASGKVTQSYLYYYDGALLDTSTAPSPPVSPSTQQGHLTGIAGDGFSKSFFYRADGLLARSSIDIIGQRTLIADYDYFDNGTPRRQRIAMYTARSSTLEACLVEEVTKEVVIDALGLPQQMLINQELVADVARDELGRVETIALPDGSVVQKRYDPYTLSEIGFDRLLVDGRVLSSKFTISPRGLIETERLDGFAGSLERRYSYTPQGFLQSVTDNGLQTETYTFDEKTGLAASLSELGSQGYTFDRNGRLITRAPAGEPPVSYSYGLDGQIHDVCDGGSCEPSKRTARFIYDERGYRLATLDANGLLASARTALGVIASPSLDDRRLRLVENVSIAGIDVAFREPGAFASIATDVRGTNLGDEISERPSAFGTRAAQPKNAAVSAYAGAPLDENTGLLRVGVRDYDPRTKQFVQPDPLLVAHPQVSLFAPNAANLFSYAGNDPVNRIDASGMLDEAWLQGQRNYPIYDPISAVIAAALVIAQAAGAGIGSAIENAGYAPRPAHTGNRLGGKSGLRAPQRSRIHVERCSSPAVAAKFPSSDEQSTTRRKPTDRRAHRGI